ncbi:hypothetical protein CRG98_023634 [Punica granatum]|uniref:Uncharacterized protein n=1 Tax=Punica granatum TaxID=22663 RepID=A0A2I0JI89_PUNGR|nr:hypothetical protein CRG98_023634 [Punica granatum]
MLRKFAEPTGSCFLQPCWVCSPVRVYFHASQVRRACSLVLLATLQGLLTRTSSLSCFASSLSLPARLLQPCRVSSSLRVNFYPTQVRRACPLPSHNLAGSAHPCEFTFRHRKFVEPPRSCLLSLATLPGQLTRASLLLRFVSSPSLLAPASCNLAESNHPCEFNFILHKFAEPAGSCLLQCCLVCSPRASSLSCFASSPRLLALASCNLAGSSLLLEFNFMLRKFAEPAGSCLLQSCRVCSPVGVYFDVSQVC